MFRHLKEKQIALGYIFDSINSKFEKFVPPFSPQPMQVYTEEHKTQEFTVRIDGSLYEHPERPDAPIDSRILLELSHAFVESAIKQGFMTINRYLPPTDYQHQQSEAIVLSGRLVEIKK